MLRPRPLLPYLLAGGFLAACESDEQENLGGLGGIALQVRSMVDETREPEAGEDPPRLPSVRRLLSFMPDSLTGRQFEWSTTDVEPEDGESSAAKNYCKPSQRAMPLSLEVEYFDSSGRRARKYRRREGEETEIAGFKAVQVEPDVGNREVIIWIADCVVVRAEGSMKMSELREAAASVQLAELSRQLDSKELFEPCRDDRIADSILSRSDMDELAPESIGPVAVLSSRSRRKMEGASMEAAVEVHSILGMLEIFDYGTADRVSLGYPMDFSDHTEFEAMKDEYAYDRSEFEHQGAQISQVLGTARKGSSKMVSIFLRAQFGRFSVSYAGQWMPPPKTDDQRVLEQMRQNGIGVFENHQSQILAIFAALPWDAMKTWNDKSVQ